MSAMQRGPQAAMKAFTKPQNPKATLKRLWSYLRVSRWSLLLAMLAVALSSLSSVALGAFLKPMINILIESRDAALFARYLLAACAVMLIGVVMTYLAPLLIVRIAQRTGAQIREHLFSHLQELPVPFFDTRQTGDLMSAFTNDVENINQALQQTLPNLLSALLTVIGTFGMMLWLSAWLTLLVLLMLGLMIFLVSKIGRLSARNFREQQAGLGGLNAYVEEMMSGQKVVKVFNHEQEAEAVFAAHNEKLRESSTKAQTFAVVMMPLMGNLAYLQFALTAMAGAALVIAGRLDIGSVAAFLQYSRSFSQPLAQLSNQMNLLIGAIAGAERVFALLDEAPEADTGDVGLERAATPQAEWYWLVPEAGGGQSRVPVQGAVRFEDVCFSYVEGQRVLNAIHLYAKPGQKIALVGSTGAGKTTITNLLNRFYELDSGRIYFDGIELSRIRKDSLRAVLGMVLQDLHLFEGSIADNIRYGRLEASDAEVEQAARIANADSFIRHLPEGYATRLTREGGNLSQGQRQLLSIARAAVANPAVLVLDEATSAIDTRTERLIELGMDGLMRGRTSFSIAHRLSTVRHANAILVLEAGEIIERGDHDQLMALGGRYYELNVGALELD